jgi:RHS repeat-associated protein
LSTTNAKGSTTRYEYDALGRLIKKLLPLGMSELYTYDQVGNLVTRTDYRGKQTTYDYDSMDRLTARRPDSTLGEVPITFTYTETGQRRTMSDASGITTYTYDVRDRLISKETPQGTLTYTHDATGGLTGMVSSNADGVSVNYEYDDAYRLTAVKDNRTGSASTTSYTYDTVGNLASTTRANGVRSDYTYNSINRLLNLVNGKSGATQSSYAYTVDKTGRRLSVNEFGGRVVNYTYDSAYRLKRETVSGDSNPAKNGAIDYTLDPVGNRLSRISTIDGVLSQTSNYDANDRLTSDVYDANGNTRSANGRSFTYDFEDRVRTANGGAVRIVYDGDGNLASKTVGGVTTKYLVDEMNPTGYSQVVEEIVAGEVQTQYTYGHTILSQRRRTTLGWSVDYYSADGHGNIRQLTNESGVVTDTYTYDGFGKLLSQTGTTPNPYLYAGERFDADLGLYHLRARYYDTDRGRFMNADPYPGEIDEPASLHKYLYAFADPVNFIDPSGLMAMAEYGTLIRNIALRTVHALWRLGRAIACIFLKAASIIAAFVDIDAWLQVVIIAASLFLRHCVCQFQKKKATILGENMRDRVRPFANRTGGRYLNDAADNWPNMTPRQRWKANDSELRRRIRAGDSFRYIGKDPKRSDAARRRFDLTRSELDRLRDRGIPWEEVPIEEIMCVLGRR